MVFIRFNMANPDQKTLLIEQASIEIKEICTRLQSDSAASNSEVKALLRNLSNLWETEEKDKFGFR